jgi:hypothetical protein
MTRPLYARVLSLALTLWVSLFMSESEWVVQCPAHGGGVHGASMESHGEDSHGEMAATAITDATADHDHAGEPSSPENDASHSCSCPGPGGCPPAVAVVPGSNVPLAHIVAVHEAAAVSTLDLFAAGREHVQPPATAPPALVLAPAV